MDYVVKTEVFEGPFDLLLHLIARQRVDLWQVSLSRITEDYLAEIRRMRELNLEVATEFLVVAATLLARKAAPPPPAARRRSRRGRGHPGGARPPLRPGPPVPGLQAGRRPVRSPPGRAGRLPPPPGGRRGDSR